MKLLILGKPRNFINQIVTSYNDNFHDIDFSIVNENNIKLNKAIITLYKNVINPKFSIASFFYILNILPKISLLFIKSLMMLFISFRQGIKSLNLLGQAILYLAKLQDNNIKHFEIINIHYLSTKKAIITNLLPKKNKIIISFWGSDLFRQDGVCNYFWTLKSLNRADIIQISSVEMEQTILIKYGFHLKPKIKYAKFLPDYKLINLIEEFRNNDLKINKFKKKHNIPPHSTCICIGNNGSIGNQHIKTLEAIKNIPQIQDCTILLPLTYGLNKEYENTIDHYIKENSLNIICFKTFLTWEDLAILRISSDIFITMQITDAMSDTLSETLFAGNICITGAWLPYSSFRESGASFIDCKDFSTLPLILTKIINNVHSYKQKCKKNPPKVLSYFYNKENLTNEWYSLFLTEKGKTPPVIEI